MSVKIKETRLGNRGSVKGKSPTSSACCAKKSSFCKDWQGVAKAPAKGK